MTSPNPRLRRAGNDTLKSRLKLKRKKRREKTIGWTTFLLRAAHKVLSTSCNTVRSYDVPLTRLARQNGSNVNQSLGLTQSSTQASS